MIVKFEEWGRGFLTFGPRVREGSHAVTPTAWVKIRVGVDETPMTLAEIRQVLSLVDTGGEIVSLAGDVLLGDPDIDLEFGLRAFVAYVETCPNPRWFDTDRPAPVPAAGPTGEQPGGTVVLHTYGAVFVAKIDGRWEHWFTTTPAADLPGWVTAHDLAWVDTLAFTTDQGR